MQKHPTSPAKDNEALTKVQKWLLSSPQPTVLPKSKSIPLGLTERTHRQAQKGTRKTRPSKSATNLLSGEKTRLQVVFKPPFRFSVKICKSDKTKVVLDKSSKPDADRKRPDVQPPHTSGETARNTPPDLRTPKRGNSTRGESAASTAVKTESPQNRDSSPGYVNLPRSASDAKVTKTGGNTKPRAHKKSNSVGQKRDTTESRQNLLSQEESDPVHVYENLLATARSCSMPRRDNQTNRTQIPSQHFYDTVNSLGRGAGEAPPGGSMNDVRGRPGRTSRQNSLADRAAVSKLKRQLSENEVGRARALRGFHLVVGKDKLKRQLSDNELSGSRVRLCMPVSAGAEPRQNFQWNKRASLDCEASLVPRASTKRATYTFGDLKHSLPDAPGPACPDPRVSSEEFLNTIDN